MSKIRYFMKCILIPKYYFIASYRMKYKKKEEEPTIQYRKNMIKCIKIQNLSGSKIINWGSSRGPKLKNFI